MRIVFMLRQSFLLFILLGLLCGELSAAEPSTNSEQQPVWGANYRGGILIGWRPEIWPQEQTGFRVYRKELKEKKFALMTAETVKPDITMQNAHELGLKDAVQRIREGTVNEIPSEVLLKVYCNFGVSEYVALRENDPQMLQLSGFGWVDYSTNPGMEYTYKVVPIISGKEAAEMGRVTLKAGAGKPSLPLENFTASRVSDSRVDLMWTVDRLIYEQTGLIGFRIFASAVEDPVTEFDPVMVIASQEQDLPLKITYAYHDLTNNSKHARKYALQPIFRGNREGALSKRIVAQGAKGKLPDPVLKSSDFTPAGSVSVKWEYPENKPFTGFNIYRLEGKEKIKLNNQPLSASTRSFTDTQPPQKPQTVFRYQIEALSGDYRLSPLSHEALPLRTPYPVPGKPLNLQAKRIISEGVAAYELRWEKPEISGHDYRLKQLVGDRWVNAQPATTKHVLTIPVDEFPIGEKLTYTITAINKDGISGEASEPITLIAYSEKKLKAVSSLKATPAPAGARLSWRYFAPESFKGFRLYVDDKLTIDENLLGPLVRRIFIPGLTPGRNYNIKIVAISDSSKEGKAELIQVTPREVRKTNLPDYSLDISLLKDPKVRHKKIYFGDTPHTGTAVEFDYITDRKGRKWFHGTKKAYNPDGTLFSEHHYYAGKMHGSQKWFGPEGKLIREIIFEHGKPVKQ